MQKKLISLLLIFTVVFGFCSCTRDERVNFSELTVRLEKNGNGTEFPFENAFLSDSRWFLFFSVFTENDYLLSALQDENGLLTQVSVSSFAIGDTDKENAFVSACENLCEAFMPLDFSVEEMLKTAGVYDENKTVLDGNNVSQEGRYKISYFVADIGKTLIIDMIY